MHGVAYFPVPRALQRSFATLHRAELRAGAPVTLPAILGQIWFSAKPMWWTPPRSSGRQRVPASALIGFTSRCFQVVADEDTTLFGCGLWPLGWAEVVRTPASALVDRAVDAAAVWPEICARWHGSERSTAAEGWGDSLREVAEALAAGAVASPDADRIGVIDAWLAGDAGPAELAALLRVSPRQAERITARTHGGSPRLLAGKWRALRAASEMEAGDRQGDPLLSRFADQSHMIREFRRFIGETPKPFSARPSLARRIVADAWHLESDHPLALTQRRGQARTQRASR